MRCSQSSSGVIGLAGRVPAIDDEQIRSAVFRLAGTPLPLTGTARIYTCGITPYDVTHLGHAATFVWADLLATVAYAAGVTADVCRNVTDVDDVLTRAAMEQAVPYDELAAAQEFKLDRDMRALGVARPGHTPHARGHVGDVVQLAAALLESGHAYEREGAVYFRGGDIAERHGLSRDEALELMRQFGENPDDPVLDDPFDVPVWRPSTSEEPAWPSPWAWGRPGWHAECAAMAWCELGTSVDVLAGGRDLAFPHHAYQAAMVEAASGVAPFSRRRFHVGYVLLEGQKMAKSTRNLVLVRDLLEEHSGQAIRLMLLNRPWREAWNFTPDELDSAERLLEQLRTAADDAPAPHSGETEVLDGVLERLLDDLDVPGAVEVALDEGGAAAQRLVSLLKLAKPES